MNRKYFIGLDGARAIAAISVVIAHIEVYKSYLGLPTLLHSGHTYILGKKSLTAFFILSGFLITYNLLNELRERADIDLKKFYRNRMLRILPLYFLVVILGFFIYPFFLQSIPLWDSAFFKYQFSLFLIHLLLIPNLRALISDMPLPYVGPLWSIGVEQQFYIAWPFLMRKLKENPLSLFLIVIAVCTIVRLLCLYFYGNDSLAFRLSEAFEFESFAFGAIAAYLLVNKKNDILGILFQKKVQILCVLFLIWAGYNSRVFSFFDKIAYGTCITVLLLNIAANPASIFKLQNRVFRFLGKISYGIYAYHAGAIFLFLTVLDRNLPVREFNFYLYAGTLICTIIVAALSFYLYESIFLRKKEKTAHGYPKPAISETISL